jgi:splicing factor 3A subunit 1
MKLASDAKSRFRILAQLTKRTEWETKPAEVCQRELHASDAERSVAAAIDWQDFVVVETVTFDDEDRVPGAPLAAAAAAGTGLGVGALPPGFPTSAPGARTMPPVAADVVDADVEMTIEDHEPAARAAVPTARSDRQNVRRRQRVQRHWCCGLCCARTAGS